MLNLFALPSIQMGRYGNHNGMRSSWSVWRSMRVWVTLAILAASTVTAQQSTCNAGDAAALQDFKSDFLQNVVFSTWLPGTDCCSFVQCNTAGRVVGITIVADRTGLYPDPNNAGVVGESLGRLTALQTLTLIGVRFYGPIPTAWKALTSLTSLYVGMANFTGFIPAEIGQLKNLNELRFYVGNLEGPLPSAICQLGNLNRLEIETQFLSGPLPSCLPKLTKLQFFSLADNQLSGQISSSMGDLRSLQYLSLDSNHYSGSIPAALGKLSNLQTLRLFDNQLSGSIPPELGNARELKEINLDNNQISGNIPAALTKLVNLQLLSINNNRLSGAIPRHIGNFLSMTSLGLSYNHLSGPVPAEIGGLKVSPTTGTVFISIDHNSLSGSLPNTLSNVGTLLASFNRLTGGFPLSLCVNGYSVDLSHNLLDSAAPFGTLPSNPTLQILDMSYNRFTGPIPSWLLSVSSLTTLDISDNRFNVGGIPASLLGLPALDTFRFGNNLLRAPLPTGPFQSSITSLYLHNVQLTSTFPSDFFPKFPNLRSLDMSENMLEGPLPANIAQLTSLFRVDLSNNKLNGKVPDLSTLTQLEYLNLSRNMFQPPVPSIP